VNAIIPLSRDWGIARAERGELRPARKMKKRFTTLDDPLLQVNEYGFDGPIGPTTNSDIDSTVCGV
jgi:hypothetical protein